MTTDRSGLGRSFPSRAGRLVLLTHLVLAVWFCGMSLATRYLEPTSDVVVISASRTRELDLVIASRASIVDIPKLGVIARGDGPGFVADLYARGAWLVLPARFGGCAGRSIGKPALLLGMNESSLRHDPALRP